MKKDDLIYYLAFSHFLGIGPVKFALLKKHFSSAKKAYLAGKKELVEAIGSSLTEKFVAFRNQFDPVEKMEELKKKEIAVLPVDDEEYPESLKNISDPPICLYVRGEHVILGRIRQLAETTPESARDDSGPNFAKASMDKQARMTKNLFFSIVGTRNPTQYGIQVTRKFARELTEAGFVIVSGMAYGIDTIAHQSCLDAGGKTIAVLGCGVDIVYPAANRALYQSITHTGGAVISEFPPGQFMEKGLFIARNRLISALSIGVMVVEGSKDSGSLITARFAAEQGKDVFAPPNPITSNMSEAPNILLKQGAKLVTSIEDILEEFDMKITPKKKEDILEKLTTEEKEIYLLIEKRPLLIDEITIALKKPVTETMNILSLLEIEGVVEKNSDSKYQIKLY